MSPCSLCNFILPCLLWRSSLSLISSCFVISWLLMILRFSLCSIFLSCGYLCPCFWNTNDVNNFLFNIFVFIVRIHSRILFKTRCIKIDLDSSLLRNLQRHGVFRLGRLIRLCRLHWIISSSTFTCHSINLLFFKYNICSICNFSGFCGLREFLKISRFCLFLPFPNNFSFFCFLPSVYFGFGPLFCRRFHPGCTDLDIFRSHFIFTLLKGTLVCLPRDFMMSIFSVCSDGFLPKFLDWINFTLSACLLCLIVTSYSPCFMISSPSSSFCELIFLRYSFVSSIISIIWEAKRLWILLSHILFLSKGSDFLVGISNSIKDFSIVFPEGNTIGFLILSRVIGHSSIFSILL
ncbi:unnamed protein product [Moneuplotes crassus]|uniref:Uncharacterized protein n=1 Tax=Euplotes crassus TaxID=5936 RepID=A0AAD1U3G3_EUPCR|nr:unnamed protein product [Moneuplotes crassus]